jgi:ankyrin repeat protein
MWVVWNSAQAYPRYVVTYSSLPNSHDAGDRCPAAAAALRTLGCAEAYVRDALPPPPPPLPHWNDAASVSQDDDDEDAPAAALLSGAATKQRDSSADASVWEWEDGAAGSGEWRPYTRDACARLDSALAAGEQIVNLYGAYAVDLGRFEQTKRRTGYVRAVRCIGAAPESARESPAGGPVGSAAGRSAGGPAGDGRTESPTAASGVSVSAALPSAPPPPVRSASETTLDTVARACRRAARVGSLSDVETIVTSHPEAAAECDADGHNALHCVAMRIFAVSSSGSPLSTPTAVGAANTPSGSAATSDAAQLSVDIMRLLLAQGEGLGVDARDIAGRTALWLAAGVGQPNIALVAALVSEGASVDLADEFDVTALGASSRRGHGALVAALLEHGADANARCAVNSTPLIAAAEGGHLDVVNTLIETGHAEVDAADTSGDTALIAAAREGHADVALLIANEWWASLHHANNQGLTARDVARANGRYELEKALVQAAYERRVVDRCPSRAQCAALSPEGRTTAVAACMRGCCMDTAWYFFSACCRPFAMCLDYVVDLLIVLSMPIWLPVHLTAQFVHMLWFCCGAPGCAGCILLAYLSLIREALSDAYARIVRQLLCVGLWCDIALCWTCCPSVRAGARGESLDDSSPGVVIVKGIAGCCLDDSQLPGTFLLDQHHLCRSCRPDAWCCEDCLEVDGSIRPWVAPPPPPPPPSAPAPTRGGGGGDEDATSCAIQ